MNENLVKPSGELPPYELDIIRSETALSRYPIHRLANKGTVNIEIRKKDEKGNTFFLWEVSHNSRYGQPGPLAYKLDTLVVNRRIDEAGRPIPKVLKMGSLRELADDLDLGGDTNLLKKALRQNASAFITAKTTYKGADGAERYFEFSDTRYGVVFTGEKLPDGRKADAVYLIFHDLYLKVLNTAPRRPLDYDYLRDLAPAPQRFYEIVSYEMLPAIKYKQRAKLPYSEFCMYSTMTRYFEFEQVKKQMWKIHQPHIKAGYLAKAVEYEATVDEEGRPDWNMFYTPGELAKRQQLAFEFNIPYVKRERPKLGKPLRTSRVSEPAISEPELPLVPASTLENPKARDLVRKFYKLRYDQVQEPTEREVGEANQYLSDGEDWANYLIEFAAKRGKDNNGFPNDFGGAKKLVSQAREPFKAKRQVQRAALLKKARQSHQEAHRAAYHAFLGELLGGKLEASLPEAFMAYTAQEKSNYQFHKHRADKSKVSANIVESYYDAERRIERFLKFTEENPRMGIPNFWQWDEKFNPQAFRDPEDLP